MRKWYFIILAVIQSTCSISLAQQNLKFKHFTTNEGLSQNHVLAILKDRKGYMWFGTEEGLNRYDGYEFVVYKHDVENKNSIGANYIYDVLEDRSGTLWVATVK